WIERRQHTLAALEHRHFCACARRDVRELGRDVAAADHHDAFRQMLKLHERIARDGMLRPGKLQRDRPRATGYQDVTGLQGASLDGKLIGSREPGHAVKGIDALAREVLLALMPDGISKAPLEGDQLFPIYAQVSRDAVPMHPPRQIDRL